jgi:hypothetical protein
LPTHLQPVHQNVPTNIINQIPAVSSNEISANIINQIPAVSSNEIALNVFNEIPASASNAVTAVLSQGNTIAQRSDIIIQQQWSVRPYTGSDPITPSYTPPVMNQQQVYAYDNYVTAWGHIKNSSNDLLHALKSHVKSSVWKRCDSYVADPSEESFLYTAEIPRQLGIFLNTAPTKSTVVNSGVNNIQVETTNLNKVSAELSNLSNTIADINTRIDAQSITNNECRDLFTGTLTDTVNVINTFPSTFLTNNTLTESLLTIKDLIYPFL